MAKNGGKHKTSVFVLLTLSALSIFTSCVILTCQLGFINKCAIAIILEKEVGSVLIIAENVRPRLAQDRSYHHTAPACTTNEPQMSQLISRMKKKVTDLISDHPCLSDQLTCWPRPWQPRPKEQWCLWSHRWQSHPFPRERGGQCYLWHSWPHRLSNGLFPAEQIQTMEWSEGKEPWFTETFLSQASSSSEPVTIQDQVFCVLTAKDLAVIQLKLFLPW